MFLLTSCKVNTIEVMIITNQPLVLLQILFGSLPLTRWTKSFKCFDQTFGYNYLIARTPRSPKLQLDWFRTQVAWTLSFLHNPPVTATCLTEPSVLQTFHSAESAKQRLVQKPSILREQNLKGFIQEKPTQSLNPN